MASFLKSKEKLLLGILWVAVILAAIKSIFTDTGFDNSYMVAMSYRHLRGDSMFTYMWEPHQTAIFLNDILMWVYHIFVPSYTGVVVYLQICGSMLLGAAAFIIYRILRPLAGKNVASVAAAFFFIFRAKQSPFPDYANLQICLSVLLFLCIIEYLKAQDKWWLLVLAGIFLCLEVLSYPSGIITFIPVAIYLFVKADKKWKSLWIFTAVCGVIGCLYTAYFVIKIGIDAFIINVNHIIFADTHYLGEVYEKGDYLYEMEKPLFWILGSVVAVLLIKGIGKLLKKDIEFLPVFGIAMLISEVAMLFLQRKLGIDWTCVFYILPILLIVIGAIWGYKKMSSEEKNVWTLGLLISASSFFATVMLSDLWLLTILPYLVLGGTVSFIPVSKIKEASIGFLMAICLLTAVHRGLVVWGYGNQTNHYMLYESESLVRGGPSAGIICDDWTNYQISYDREDHNRFVSKDDNLLLLTVWIIDSLEYMLTDANISNSSVIDTPTYTEHLLDYYELYPEKFPTVVAVSCWDGKLKVAEDSMIMQWVDEHFTPVGDGRYWKYYRAKE